MEQLLPGLLILGAVGVVGLVALAVVKKVLKSRLLRIVVGLLFWALLILGFLLARR